MLWQPKWGKNWSEIGKLRWRLYFWKIKKLCSFKTNFVTESSSWISMKMKAHFKNKSVFSEWKYILKMKAHFENESTFWQWKHILKMKANFENESTIWNCPKEWKLLFQTENQGYIDRKDGLSGIASSVGSYWHAIVSSCGTHTWWV